MSNRLVPSEEYVQKIHEMGMEFSVQSISREGSRRSDRVFVLYDKDQNGRYVPVFQAEGESIDDAAEKALAMATDDNRYITMAQASQQMSNKDAEIERLRLQVERLAEVVKSRADANRDVDDTEPESTGNKRSGGGRGRTQEA